MKFSMLTYLLSRNLDYPEIVDWAGQNGFECLEIDCACSAAPRKRAMLNLPEILSAGETGLAEYVEPLKRNNLTVATLFNYGPNKLDADPEMRKRAQEGLKETIRAAALLGAPVVVTNIGSHLKNTRATVDMLQHKVRTPVNPWGIYYHAAVHPDRDRLMQEGFEVAAENYVPLADFAAEHGVKIAFEPAPQGSGSGAVAYSPETFDGLFKVAEHPALGLNFDASHFIWQGIDYLSYAARLAREGRIFSCHAKDTEIIWSRVKYAGWLSDGWWRFRLPGWGETDWPELIRTLRRNGYDSVLTLEQEDLHYGWKFDEDGRSTDIDLVKKGYLMGLEYLRNVYREAGG